MYISKIQGGYFISLAAPRRRGRRPGVEKLLAQRYGEESGNTIKNQTSAEDGNI